MGEGLRRLGGGGRERKGEGETEGGAENEEQHASSE